MDGVAAGKSGLAAFGGPFYVPTVNRLFIRLLNGALIVCFLMAAWGGWYLSRQGFGKKWRKKLTEEFAKRGVQMTARRLTLDPLRGLVAREVRVYSNSNQDQIVAKIDELRLDIDYTRMLRNEPFLDGISLSEAEVFLDFDPRRKNSGETTIHHLEARLFFAPDHLEIRRFSGEGMGLRFSIEGTLDHGAAWQISTDPTHLWKRFTSLPPAWLERIAGIRFGSRLGRLDLRFHGDLTKNQLLQSAEMELECPRIRWRGVEFRSIRSDADFTNSTLTLRRLSWQDDRGPASLTGVWKPGEEGNLQLDSNLDGTPIFQQIDPLFGVAVAGPMHLNAGFSWTEKPEFSWRILGDLNASDVLFRGVKWDQIISEFSAVPDRWLARNLQLTQKSGLISGQILKEDQTLRAEMTSTADPQSIWQTLSVEVPSDLREAEFPVNPLIKVSVGGPFHDPAKWQIDGEMTLGRTHFRGVALTSGQAIFSAQGSWLSLSSLQITRPEGQFSGDVFWNSATGDLSFWNAENTIDIVALGLWMDNSLAGALETLRSGKGTEMEGSGVLHWKNDRLATGEIHLTSEFFGVFDALLLQKLVRNLAGNDLPKTAQATVTLDNDVLRADPLLISGEKWQLSGKMAWELRQKQFSGVLNWFLPFTGSDVEKSVWQSLSPWSDIVWKRSANSAGN